MTKNYDPNNDLKLRIARLERDNERMRDAIGHLIQAIMPVAQLFDKVSEAAHLLAESQKEFDRPVNTSQWIDG